MKKQVLLLLILLTLNLASATILIEDLQKTKYKIGEKIELAVTISTNEEGQLFFSSTLECPSDSLNFFKIPIEAQNNNYIDIPPITITKDLVGDCKVKFRILDSKENTLEKAETETLEIKNKLDLEFSTDKDSYKPGESIILEGRSEKNSEMSITLEDGNTIIAQINKTLSENIFSILIELPETLSSGPKELFIKAEDNHGNQAKNSTFIQIEQIPKTLSLTINPKSIKPRENITISSTVKDQSEITINSNITYRIFDPNSNLIESLTSDQQITISPEAPIPGEYIVKALSKLRALKIFY